MASASQSETHPIKRLGVTLSEIERRTAEVGFKVLRPNLWQVVERHRDRLGWDSYDAIKKAFPDFDIESARRWRWSEHGGLVPYEPAKKRTTARLSRSRRGVRQ